MSSYFSHDSNARSDSKIIALRIKHGWEGYGLYWALIEKLRDDACYKLSTDYNLLAYDLRADASMIKSIINGFGLFSFTANGECFYSESLLQRMEEKDAKSAKARESANKRWDRDKEEYERNANASKTDANAMLLKERKVKEKKDIILSDDNISAISTELAGSSSSSTGEEPEEVFPVEQPEEVLPKAKPEAKAKPKPEANAESQKIAGLWNTVCTGYRSVLKLSEKRKNKIRLRIVEMGGMEKAYPLIESLFGKMQESRFLRGEGHNGWRADFDWVFENDTNYLKVLEGKYDNNNQKTTDNETSKTSFGTNPDLRKEKRDNEFAEHILSKLGGGDQEPLR